MRIAIDLQAAQAANRHRGIGRYALSLTKAILRNAPEHECVIVLNAAFPQAVDELREALRDLIEPEAIRIWQGPLRSQSWRTTSSWQRRADELVRDPGVAGFRNRRSAGRRVSLLRAGLLRARQRVLSGMG